MGNSDSHEQSQVQPHHVSQSGYASNQFTPQQQVRCNELVEIFLTNFRSLNSQSLNEITSQHQLYVYFDNLTKKNGQGPYDQDIHQQLVEQIEKSGAKLTINKYISVYVDAEELVKHKCQHMFDKSEDIEKKILELESQRNNPKYQNVQSPVQNFVVVNQITVKNIEAIDEISQQPFAFLSLGQNKYETNYKVSPNPSWKLNDCRFPILTLEDDLFLRIFDVRKDQYTNENFQYGYLKVSIDQLPMNQKAKWTSFDLRKSRKLNERDGINSKILLDAHVEINNIDMAINDLQGKRNEYQEERQQFEKQLAALRGPFLTQNSPQQIQSSHYDHHQSQNQNFLPIQKSSTEQYTHDIVQSQPHAKVSTSHHQGYVNQSHHSNLGLERAETIHDHVQKTDWIFIIYLFLAVLVSFKNARFLDLTLGASFLCVLHRKKLKENHAIIAGYLFMICTSIIYDIAWLGVFYKYSTYDFDMDDNNDRGLTNFCMFFVFVLFFFKIVVLISLSCLVNDQHKVEKLETEHTDTVKRFSVN